MKLMNRIVTAVVLAVSVSGMAVAEGNAEAGKQKTAACSGCHGADGNSPAPSFPKLAGQGERYLVKQLQDFKSGKRQNGIMQVQVANLSDQDMADIAAYYSSQEASIGKADPELIELGEALYRGGDLKKGVAACTACHGGRGKGVDAASFPALGGQHAAYLVAQLKAFRAAGRGDHEGLKRINDAANADEVGMMQAIAAKLSDDDIVALSSYIQGLH